MSRVDELIRELCPDGVERIRIVEVCSKVLAGGDRPSDVIKGEKYPTDDRPYPVYSNGKGEEALYGYSSTKRVDDKAVTVSARGTIGYHTVREPGFTPIVRLITLIPNQDKISADYLNVALYASDVLGTQGGIPQLTVPMMKEALIPVPPLEVQEEIVRILDQFVELDRELEQEIAGRTAQFDRLREDLLSDENYPPVPVGNLAARVSTGATPKASEARYYQGGDIPWLRTGEVNFGEIWETEKLITQTALDETNVSWIAENCVVVAISGATAGRVAVNKIPMTTNQHCCNMQIDPEMANYRFVFHALASSYEEMKAQGRGARGDLNISLIKGFPIPLPPLEVQEEIANKLDTFTEYVDNLKRERELRQKQYEYYRDQLLDFPVKE